eukprot:1569480-Pyramimonas_sp.AAC.1
MLCLYIYRGWLPLCGRRRPDRNRRKGQRAAGDPRPGRRSSSSAASTYANLGRGLAWPRGSDTSATPLHAARLYAAAAGTSKR